MYTLDLNKIIGEASKLGYTFSLKDAQDVIDSIPRWYMIEETEKQAVADYIDAYGG